MRPLRVRGGGAAAAIYVLCCALLLGACAAPALSPTPASAAPAVTSVLPAADVVPGWQRREPRTYDPDTLYDFVNGAADLYFTYGFRELAVAEWANSAGDGVQVEVYRVASDADAYGLYTYNSYGEPVEIGVDGEINSGYRAAFWQGNTFVQVVASGQVEDDLLRTLAQAASSALPDGGQRPALVATLPEEGLQPGSVRFFREKMALDNLLWIGAEDLLGLGADVQGIVARYQVEGQAVDLLLISFPDRGRAQAAAAGLAGARLENLIDTAVSGVNVGAVFGSDAGRSLLDAAMENL